MYEYVCPPAETPASCILTAGPQSDSRATLALESDCVITKCPQEGQKDQKLALEYQAKANLSSIQHGKCPPYTLIPNSRSLS